MLAELPAVKSSAWISNSGEGFFQKCVFNWIWWSLIIFWLSQISDGFNHTKTSWSFPKMVDSQVSMAFKTKKLQFLAWFGWFPPFWETFRYPPAAQVRWWSSGHRFPPTTAGRPVGCALRMGATLVAGCSGCELANLKPWPEISWVFPYL